MIVKTGANYQAEGGYIEFAIGANTATVNGVAVPSIVYSDSISVTGLQRFSITRTSGIAGTVRFIRYGEYTSLTGEKFYDYQSVVLGEGVTGYVTLPSGFGSLITTPAGYHPKLGEGSENVKIVQSGSSYYLITLGKSPNAVIELEADA